MPNFKCQVHYYQVKRIFFSELRPLEDCMTTPTSQIPLFITFQSFGGMEGASKKNWGLVVLTGLNSLMPDANNILLILRLLQLPSS